MSDDNDVVDEVADVLNGAGMFAGVDPEFERWAREAMEARHRRDDDRDDSAGR